MRWNSEVEFEWSSVRSQCLGRLIGCKIDDLFEAQFLEKREIQLIWLSASVEVLFYHSKVDRGDVMIRHRVECSVLVDRSV